MKKNVFLLSIIFIVSISLLVACSNENNTINAPLPTAIIDNDTFPIQPHLEMTFTDMAAFINTVDENTFENGEFKDIIERVRIEDYIIRPYFDGEPASPRENREQIML